MRVVIIGSGLVGSSLGPALRAAGHTTVGTTTTASRLLTINDRFDEVALLRGSDSNAVNKLVDGADVIVVTAGPAASSAMSRDDRAASYHDVLVRTAESVAGAPSGAQVIMCSALSVYGDAANGCDEVDEDSPLTTSDDPSPSMFRAAEETYRRLAGDRACIFRCADIWGADDLPIEDKVRFAHELLGGSVPFQAESLFYRVHVDDVVAAMVHSIDRRLVGTFNLTCAEPPDANASVFDAISAQLGFPPLEYRGEIKGPTVPISVSRLASTGFTCTHC
jgi:nucleoside-diphosphate-sugar epimerase